MEWGFFSRDQAARRAIEPTATRVHQRFAAHTREQRVHQHAVNGPSVGLEIACDVYDGIY
jgi:hypothetical protein